MIPPAHLPFQKTEFPAGTQCPTRAHDQGKRDSLWRAGSLRARLAAMKHSLIFWVRGRPVPKQPEKAEKRRITLPEFEELLRENKENQAQTR